MIGCVLKFRLLVLFILSNLSLFKHPERSVDVEFERETDVKEKLNADPYCPCATLNRDEKVR